MATKNRRPCLVRGASRWLTLTWPRQIPLDAEPADAAEIADACSRWLSASNALNLFINTVPDSVPTAAQREATVPGYQLTQEDSPAKFSHAIAEWLAFLR